MWSDQSTPVNPLPPILFNYWKHHAGALRLEIDRVAEDRASALLTLPKQLLVIGTELMDLYIGQLMPDQIATHVLTVLRSRDLFEANRYRRWMEECGGYHMLTLADGSRWVLRTGDAERYVHIHPGRWATHTRRVRANVLKTAVMACAYARVYGGDATDRDLINEVRQKYLSLSPIRGLTENRGLAAVLAILGGK